MDAQIKVRGVHCFIVIINYYRDTWHKCAHTLAPLTKLCSTEIKFKLIDIYQDLFMVMNKILYRDTTFIL